MTCESLESREFSIIFLKFHFSISISSHFYFTFTSRSRFPVIFISLSFLEKSERDKNFTLFLEKKRVKFYTKFHEKFNHSSIEGEEPKTNYVRNNEWRYPTVHSRYNNKNSRFRFLLPTLKVFLHKKIKFFWGLCPVGKSDKH